MPELYDESACMRPGDYVRVVDVDMYGYMGRDLHPSKEHVGRTGIIVDVEVVNDVEEVRKGDWYVVYTVKLTDSEDACDYYEFMGFEIEKWKPLDAPSIW